jgi:hypothetical protein
VLLFATAVWSLLVPHRAMSEGGLKVCEDLPQCGKYFVLFFCFSSFFF